MGEKRGGRVAGTPNKASARVKHNIVQCFERVGGLDALETWAKENQTEFYKLWAKLLPASLRHSGSVAHKHTHESEPLSDTVAWVTRTVGRLGEDQETPKSLPN